LNFFSYFESYSLSVSDFFNGTKLDFSALELFFDEVSLKAAELEASA
jgi:hypothetical protein